MLTIEQAKALQSGDVLYVQVTSSLGRTSWKRMRVTSVKTWKTRPNEVRVGLKFGLYSAGALTERNLEYASLENPELKN
jgi:hypothetical protein